MQEFVKRLWLVTWSCLSVFFCCVCIVVVLWDQIQIICSYLFASLYFFLNSTNCLAAILTPFYRDIVLNSMPLFIDYYSEFYLFSSIIPATSSVQLLKNQNYVKALWKSIIWKGFAGLLIVMNISRARQIIG